MCVQRSDELDEIREHVPPSGADGIGDCSFTITTNGRYIARELTPPPGYSGAPDQSALVTLTSSPQTITLTFGNSTVPGRIDVQKNDDVGGPVAGAGFTLYPDNAPVGGTPNVGVGGEDLPLINTCTTDATGKCSFLSVPLGNYWVVETTTPAGYAVPTPSYQAATIGLGPSPNIGQTVSLTFVNPRVFRVIVLVCRGDGTLYPSTINVDSLGAQTSISAAQAIALGTDESTLCGITQARFDNRLVGEHAGTMTIP